MRCDRCGEDRTVTVVRSIAITRVHPSTGRESTEVRTSRLCVACGGGDAPEVLAPIAGRVQPLPPAASATSAVVDAMLAPYTRRPSDS